MNLDEARKMCEREMEKWLDSSWKFAWNNRKRSFGLCSYRKKEIQLFRILTEAEPMEQVYDTICAENHPV